MLPGPGAVRDQIWLGKKEGKKGKREGRRKRGRDDEPQSKLAGSHAPEVGAVRKRQALELWSSVT